MFCCDPHSKEDNIAVAQRRLLGETTTTTKALEYADYLDEHVIQKAAWAGDRPGLRQLPESCLFAAGIHLNQLFNEELLSQILRGHPNNVVARVTSRRVAEIVQYGPDDHNTLRINGLDEARPGHHCKMLI